MIFVQAGMVRAHRTGVGLGLGLCGIIGQT